MSGGLEDAARTRIAAAFLSVALLAFPGAAASGDLELIYGAGDERLFRLAPPDGWTLRAGVEPPHEAMPQGAPAAPRIVTLMPDDGSADMWVGLWSPPGIATLDEAEAYMRSLAETMLDEAVFGESRASTVNGAPARLLAGSARRAERDLRFETVVIALGQRVVVASAVGAPAAFQARRADLAATLDSIHAVEGSKR